MPARAPVRRLAVPLGLLSAALLLGCPGPAAPPEVAWKWTPVTGAVCADGSATGFGLNQSSRSRDVIIYLQAGGACWDQATCVTYQTASHLHGYRPTDFAAELDLTARIFDRGVPANPFRDASFVFVPYCTGDLHAGRNVATYGAALVHHAGGLNLDAILTWLQPVFPGARRIFVTGSSAGGYGAQLDFVQVAQAFPSAEVHALADSAQAVSPTGGLYPTWLDAWKPSLPAGCTACGNDVAALPGWLATTYPTSRFGLLAFEQDTVLPYYLATTTGGLQAATLGLFSSAYDPNPNARYFAQAGPGHVMLLGDLQATVGGVTLEQWLTRWYGGDAAWASVKP